MLVMSKKSTFKIASSLEQMNNMIQFLASSTPYFAMKIGMLPSTTTSFMRSHPPYPTIVHSFLQMIVDLKDPSPSASIFWLKMPGVLDVVSNAWNKDCGYVEPCHMLFQKLKRISQRLRKWSKSLFSKAKVELHMALEVILRHDMAQENRHISIEERNLRSS
jgi:hypothetical protein